MNFRTMGLALRTCGPLGLWLALTGCATAPLATSGSLTAYEDLRPDDGVTTKTKMRIDKPEILAARSVIIIPTTFASTAMKAELSEKQRRVIANAIDRSLCFGLSDRFRVVSVGEVADLNVHVIITHINVTDAGLAGASKVASIVPNFVGGGGPPIPIPRIPFGMGSLSVEAEAKDTAGRQKAALIWARGADFITSTPRVAASGDAYDLAGEFGADFSKLLVTGESPFKKSLSIPSMQRIQSSFGGQPKYAACDAFGRNSLPALVGGRMGAPPEWNDDAMPVAAKQ